MTRVNLQGCLHLLNFFLFMLFRLDKLDDSFDSTLFLLSSRDP
jgi:hypothetical protein